MKKMLLHVFLVLMLCCLVLVLPATAAVNGKIAFVSNRDGKAQIYIMNPDGTGQTRLTNNQYNDTFPAWSPDGTKIAFMSDRDGNSEIYVMNPDGTGQTRLTNNQAFDGWTINDRIVDGTGWSPDGKKIRFISDRDVTREIYVMNPDGTGQTRITQNLPSHVMDGHPALSPDGNKIAFDVTYPPLYSNPESYIFIINVDGTGRIFLEYSDYVTFGELKWSPEGIKIAYIQSAERVNHPSYTWVIVKNLDESGSREVDYWMGFNSMKWSPDSTKIAYYSNVFYDYLIVSNADGSGSTRYEDGNDGSPTWSSDSTKIAFGVNLEGNNEEIYIINADGTGKIDLTNNPASDYSPAWGPATATSSITITSPNGGEIWQRGTPHNVTWTYTGSLGSLVKIVLLKAGIEVGTISASTSIGSGGTGSYTWQMNPSGSTGSDYKVKVQSISQPTISDTSNNNFTITSAGTTAPSITVTSPNGGESWKRGTPHPITWSYTGSPGSYVKLELLQGGTPVGTATYSTSLGSGGTGSYSWAISSGRAPGTNYKIRVKSVSQPTISDTSNSDFTITA